MSKIPLPVLSLLQEKITRDTLLRTALIGSLGWSYDPSQFDFKFDNANEKSRFERFQKSLAAISSNSNSYSEVMIEVNKEDWKAADALATKHLSYANVQGGMTEENPPLLADFLVLAMIPSGLIDEFHQQAFA